MPSSPHEPAERRMLALERACLTYTVEEVATMLGISRTTAYPECVRRGEIPARRFGRRVVVTRHDLAQLLGTDV